jgi:hypothetical protein
MTPRRIAPAALALVALLLAGCSTVPSGTPEESAYLDLARGSAESAGYGWSSDFSAATLDFGHTTCAEWARDFPDNTLEQNVAGTQASIRLSETDPGKAALFGEFVAFASQTLCPAP